MNSADLWYCLHFERRFCMATEGIKHVSADLAQSTYDALKQITDESNASNMAEALRDCIALRKYLRNIQAQGGKILIEQNGKFREILEL